MENNERKMNRIEQRTALFIEGLDKMLELEGEIIRLESNKFYHANRSWPDPHPKKEQRDKLKQILIDMYVDMCKKHY